MPDHMQLWVPGKPAPQGSARAFVNKKTGRAIVTKDNDATQKTWRHDIRTMAADTWAPRDPITGPVHLILAFAMPRPLSTPKTRTPPAVKRPDLDKLTRAVCDALTSAGIWLDDSQVVFMAASKQLAALGAAPGCHITVAAPTLDHGTPTQWPPSTIKPA